MLTPARIFAALDFALKGVIVAMPAAGAPLWATITVGAICAFCGFIVAGSGPVQAGSGDTVTVRTPAGEVTQVKP